MIGSALGSPVVAPQAPALGRVIKRGPALSATASAALAISRGTSIAKKAATVPLPAAVPKPLRPIAAFGGGGGAAAPAAPAPSAPINVEPSAPLAVLADRERAAVASAALEPASFERESIPVTGGQSTFGGQASATAPDWAWIVGGVVVAGAIGWFLLKKRKSATA